MIIEIPMTYTPLPGRRQARARDQAGHGISGHDSLVVLVCTSLSVQVTGRLTGSTVLRGQCTATMMSEPEPDSGESSEYYHCVMHRVRVIVYPGKLRPTVGEVSTMLSYILNKDIIVKWYHRYIIYYIIYAIS